MIGVLTGLIADSSRKRAYFVIYKVEFKGDAFFTLIGTTPFGRLCLARGVFEGAIVSFG